MVCWIGIRERYFMFILHVSSVPLSSESDAGTVAVDHVRMRANTMISNKLESAVHKKQKYSDIDIILYIQIEVFQIST